MRFKHLSLDEQLKQTEKTDDKTVAKAQLLQSQEWKDHLADHHGTGVKAQLVDVKTTDDSDLFKKTEEKKQDEKEDIIKSQHTVEHGQTAPNSSSTYLGNTSTGVQRGAGDEYFGVGSGRLKAISGQCSCGMEIATGWQPEQPKAPQLTGGYVNPSEREREENKQQQPLYATGASGQASFDGQQERQQYTTGKTPEFGSQQDQRRRRTTAL